MSRPRNREVVRGKIRGILMKFLRSFGLISEGGQNRNRRMPGRMISWVGMVEGYPL